MNPNGSTPLTTRRSARGMWLQRLRGLIATVVVAGAALGAPLPARASNVIQGFAPLYQVTTRGDVRRRERQRQ